MIKNSRYFIYKIIEAGNDEKIGGKIYDIFMMLVIAISIIPLMFKSTSTIFHLVDFTTVSIFIIDYILRWITSDYKLKNGAVSFVKYPFTFMAIIDLISILPSLTFLNNGFRLLRIFRLIRTFKVFRVFKAFRYSRNISIIINVFKKQKDSLMVVGFLAIGYIFVTALVIFNVEPDTFSNFFEAIYWATISLTTVGYGDIFAVSTTGKVITMISALFGVAIVALPAGIITAGYMDELNKGDR